MDSQAIMAAKIRLSQEQAQIRAWLRGFTYKDGRRMTEEAGAAIARQHKLGGVMFDHAAAWMQKDGR